MKRGWPGRLECSGDALAVLDAIELGIRADLLEQAKASRSPTVRSFGALLQAQTMLSPAYMRMMLRVVPLAHKFANAMAAIHTES